MEKCKLLEKKPQTSEKTFSRHIINLNKKKVEQNKLSSIVTQITSNTIDDFTGECLKQTVTKPKLFGNPSIKHLPPQGSTTQGRKTLVLDLDETLIHSTFQRVGKVDFVLSIQLDGERIQVFVRKRPGLEEFLQRMSELFEIVIYTASIAKYALPLIERIDPLKRISHKLFRSHCSIHNGSFVKDLSLLGRDLSQVIIIDNSPKSYAYQPENAIAIPTWLGEVIDSRLEQLTPVLELLAEVSDVRYYIKKLIKGNLFNYSKSAQQLRQELGMLRMLSKIQHKIIRAPSPQPEPANQKCITKCYSTAKSKLLGKPSEPNHQGSYVVLNNITQSMSSEMQMALKKSVKSEREKRENVVAQPSATASNKAPVISKIYSQLPSPNTEIGMPIPIRRYAIPITLYLKEINKQILYIKINNSLYNNNSNHSYKQKVKGYSYLYFPRSSYSAKNLSYIYKSTLSKRIFFKTLRRSEKRSLSCKIPQKEAHKQFNRGQLLTSYATCQQDSGFSRRDFIFRQIWLSYQPLPYSFAKSLSSSYYFYKFTGKLYASRFIQEQRYEYQSSKRSSSQNFLFRTPTCSKYQSLNNNFDQSASSYREKK